MFQKIKEFLFGKPPAKQTPIVKIESAPYKVEPPAPVTPIPGIPAGPAQCGCGRSPTGLCVGLHKLSADEWAVHADNPARTVSPAPAPAPEPAQKPTPAKKVAKSAPKKATSKKPAAIKAAPKKATSKKPAAK